MSQLCLTAVWLSLDSLIASIALGPLVRSHRQRAWLIALFGLCDGLATVVGFVWGWTGVWAQFAGPLIIFCFGGYCLTAAFWNRFRANARFTFLVPVLMSFDNLVYGAARGSLPVGMMASVLALTLMSSAFAAIGFSIGALGRFSNRRTSEYSSGFALLVTGLALWLV